MTRIVATLVLTATGIMGADPGLLQVRAVYLMPMNNALDQHLANRITEEGIFQVVTDPKLADAVLTDRVGSSFEQAFDQLYAVKPADAKEKQIPSGSTQSLGSMLTDLPAAPPRVTTFAKGRGNIFLVDRKTRSVLWSEYRQIKNTTMSGVNRVAAHFVDDLRDDLEDLSKDLMKQKTMMQKPSSGGSPVGNSVPTP